MRTDSEDFNETQKNKKSERFITLRFKIKIKEQWLVG